MLQKKKNMGDITQGSSSSYAVYRTTLKPIWLHVSVLHKKGDSGIENIWTHLLIKCFLFKDLFST